ncbi:MAG: nitroreductase [Solirubrobacteraceae bacterium]|nr:nitroreductase [Solirubrobacteraceae bacterium]
MDVDRAITERRTTKRYTAEEVPEEIVRELVELATWAPNHKMSAPWRFRLLGPDATRSLVDVAPPDKKPKMTLAPTRLLVSCKVAGDPTRRLEDLLATAAAVQTLLLAATGRGIDTFWQSPTVAALPAARGLLGIPDDEELVAVVNLGYSSADRTTPGRLPVDDVFEALA